MTTLPSDPANVTGDAPDWDGMNITVGRVNPFSQLGDWVAFAPISHGAKVLYWILMAHVNMKRGARTAWPSRATLALYLDRSVASVDNYLGELESIGAINKRERFGSDGGQTSNDYILHEREPEGYAWPISVKEATTRRKTGEFSAKPLTSRKASDAKKPPKAKANTKKKTPSQLVTPPPPNLLGPNNKNLNNTKRNQTNTLPPSPPQEPAADAPTRAQDEKREGGEELEISSFIADAKTHTASVTASWRLTSSQVTRAEKAIARHLSNGWAWQQIVAEITQRPVGKPENGVGSVMTWRLENGIPVTPPADVADSPGTGETSLVLASEAQAHRELARQALQWWTKAEGKLVPRGQRDRVLGVLEDAFESGLQMRQVQEVMTVLGEACPHDWQFTNVLERLKAGDSHESIREFIRNGWRKTAEQVKREEREERDRRVEERMMIAQAFEDAGVGLPHMLNFHKGPGRAYELWALAQEAGISNPVQGLDQLSVMRLATALKSLDEDVWAVERAWFIREHLNPVAADEAYDVEVVPHRTIQGQLA